MKIKNTHKRFPGAFRLSTLSGIFGAGLLFFACSGSAAVRDAAYTPGLYRGSGKGFRGIVSVLARVSPAGIDGISIDSHNESVYPGAAAMEELLETVLEAGSTDVDVVAGATFSSRGFLDAVDDALAKAASPE